VTIATYLFPAFVYASLALCVLLSYRVAKMVNLSLGSLFTLGGYLSMFSPLASLVAGTLIGLLLHVCTKRMDVGRATLFSLGLAIAMEEALRISFRVEYVLLRSEIIHLFGSKLVLEHFLAFLVSAAFLASFLAFELKGSLGKLKLKVVEEDLEIAEVYGIDTERVRALILTVSSAICCCLGSLYLSGRVISPTIGWISLIFSCIIATIAHAFREKAYILVLPVSLGLCWLTW